MNKVFTFRKGFFLILLSLSSFGAFAQPGAVGTNNLNGAPFTCTAMTAPSGAFNQARLQATQSSVSATWEFPKNCSYTTGDGAWRPYLPGTAAITFNSTIAPLAGTGSALYNAIPGGSAGTLASTTNGNYYTFNVQNVTAPTNAYMAVLETIYNPVTINTVSNTTPSNLTNSVLVTCTTSAAPSANEYVYVRYSTDFNFTTSAISQFYFTGTTGQAIIPCQAAGPVYYYVMSSNRTAAQIAADVLASGVQTSYDMLTLNLKKNGANNYTYTQLNGTNFGGVYSVPSTCYPTVASFISALNGGTITAAVTCYVAAGYSETTAATGIPMTATGTVANTITLVKFGTGTNPTLNAGVGTSTPGSAAPDGIFSIRGGDYITIDGFTFTDGNATNPATMEFGVGMFKASATDGANNNTIQNCIFNMQRINNAGGTSPLVDGAVGIGIYNSTATAATTPITVTASTGSNSNNKIYANTINGGNIGIALIGYADISPFTLADQNNDIGGSSAITGNSILNYGGGAAATNPAAAVRTLAQYGVNISYNTIDNNNGSGVNHVTTLRGIYTNTATSATETISYNTITVRSGATTSQLSAIENAAGSTAASNTISITNNTITTQYSTSTSGDTWAIYNNAVSPATLNINSNTISVSTAATSGSLYPIFNTGSVVTTVNVNSNSINNVSCTAAATSVTFRAIYISSIASTADLSATGNNLQGVSFSGTASGVFHFIYNGNTVNSETISNNTITNITIPNTGTIQLFYLSNSTNNVTVNNNSIVTGLTCTGASSSSFMMIYNFGLPGVGTANISNNNFSNLTLSSSAGSTIGSITGQYGIFWATSSSQTSNVYNNTLSTITENGTGMFHGISLQYGAAGSSAYSNTVTGVSSAGTIIGIQAGNTSTVNMNVYSNTVNTLTSSGASSTVYGMIVGAPGSSPTLISLYGNTIHTLTVNGATAPVATGINVTAGATVNLYKNKMYNISGAAAGTTVNGINILSATTLNIYNNLIGDLRATAATSLNAINGINASASATYNVYYNTIYLNATSSSVSTFGNSCITFSSTVTSFNSRNNILVNLSTPAQEISNVATNGIVACLRRSGGTGGTVPFNYATTSNNNAYWVKPSSGTNNHETYVEGTATITNAMNTFAAMQTFMANRDQLSVTENPTFPFTTGSSANFLKFSTVVPTQIESGAVNISTFTDDYIGTIRQGNGGYAGTGTAPDIGAWELDGVYADLTAPTISYTLLGNTLCTSNRTLSPVTITDASGVNITVGTKPRLYYKKSTDANTYVSNISASNGWKYVEASNAASPFSFTTDFSLLQAPVVLGDVIQYFVVAQDLASTPNVGINSGTFAATPSSVALTGTAFPLTGTINSYTVLAGGLSGTVNVGPGQTYTTLTAAGGLFAAINASGLSGNLTATITGNISIEDGTNALNAIIYGCATYTLTIKPQTTATVSGSVASLALIKLNTACNVVIDGSNSGGTDKSLTFTNTSLTSPNVLLLASSGTTPITNVTVKNCTIINGVNTSSALVVSDGATIGNAGYFNTITLQNNDIQKAYFGIYCIATVAASNGSSLNITSNTLNTAGTNAMSHGGIYVQGVDGATVSGNNVGNFESATSEVDAGIWFATGTTNSVIEKNIIHDITYTGSAGYGGKGISVSTGNAAANISVRNNMIYAVSGDGDNFSTFGPIYCPIGIYAYGSGQGGVNIYYNSIYLSGATINKSGAYSIGICLGSTTAATIKDNIIYNQLGRLSLTGVGAVGIAAETSNTQFTSLDYNDYYTNAASGTNSIGKIGSTDYSTLALWKTSTAQEANSLNVLPNFTSTTDLHLVAGTNCGLDGYGTPISGITTDYDAQPRDITTPDMGADEFTSTYTGTLAGVAGSAVCENKNVSLSGTTFATSSCSLIAKVVPSGLFPVSGKINTCVTLQSSQQFFNGEPYVQRHFDIEPVSSNTTTTSATITLYFTNAEFVQFNTNNPLWPRLPTVAGGGNADNNRSNLSVTQYHGPASISPSTPFNYPSAVTGVLIRPGSSNVVWNGSYWAVTFNVTGFSGFYVHTNLNWPLPITVNYINGIKQAGKHLITWKVTCNTTPSAILTLERSADARNFTGVYTTNATAIRCAQPFDYTDAQPLAGMNYYRLKMVDADGKITYSNTIALLNASKGFELLNIAPNPVTSGSFKLNATAAAATKVETVISDMQGRVVSRQTITLIAGYNSIDMNVSNLAKGTYNISCISADDKTRVIRFVKQ